MIVANKTVSRDRMSQYQREEAIKAAIDNFLKLEHKLNIEEI